MWKKINYSHGCKFWIIFKQCKLYFSHFVVLNWNNDNGNKTSYRKTSYRFYMDFYCFLKEFWIKRTEIFLLFSVEILDKKNWDFYCFLKEYRITNLKNTVTKRITQWLHRESFSSIWRTLNKNYWDFYCFLKGTLDKNKNIVTKWMGIKERHIKIMDFFCIMKNLG